MPPSGSDVSLWSTFIAFVLNCYYRLRNYYLIPQQPCSTMDSTKSTSNVTLLVFHSYPNMPSYDGAVSAMQYRRSQDRKGIRSEYFAAPYTRQPASYQRVAHFLRRMESEANDKKRNIKIVYIDISPEHNEELDYVEELDKHDNIVVVTIIDHHSSKHADRLEASFPGRYLCNKGECATLQCGDGEHDELLRRIMAFIQFSEYESEDPKVSGSEECIRIAEIVYRETTGSTPLIKIDGLDLVYFILDLMMAVAEEWIPLYPKDFTAEQVDELNEAFWSCGEKYMTKLSNIVGGKVRDMFSDENLHKHEVLLDEIDDAMDKSPDAEMLIDGIKTLVICAQIGIMKYGRSLEPRARSIMRKRNCQYCIFFNPPNQGHYYLSLRRVNENYNASHLATAIKEISGSKIGGGHPWASGVHLTTEQLQVFVEKMDIALKIS